MQWDIVSSRELLARVSKFEFAQRTVREAQIKSSRLLVRNVRRWKGRARGSAGSENDDHQMLAHNRRS
eukprot:3192294-Pleurochrysis_carterae.AAC.2